MLRRLVAPLLVFLSLTAIACSSDSNGESSNEGERLNVIATTTQIGDFAANVGGDRISLTVLLQPNQDAHDFELQPSQIRAIAEADVILRNGVGLDDFIDRGLENSNAVVTTVSTGIRLQEGGHSHDHDHGHDGGDHGHDDGDDHGHDDGDDHGHDDGDDHDHGDGHDPHVWFSVDNARHMVEVIRDALSAQDSANRAFYTENATAYLQQLDALDEEIRTMVVVVPEDCRKLITNHDVFGYWASAYGFEVIGSVIPSTTTGAQASAANVAQIVQLIREENVSAIFGESSINPALIQQVGREAGVTVVPDLYGDSLGDDDSDGATYITMMRSNTTKIVEALRGCSSS